ncbi:hypothetical protein ACP275_14G017000 [Erythranthe tilingii]
MERNREARRASIVGSNGFNRRRHRTNSLRDSPDEDGGVELQESVRLRERVKKDRDRERERERDLRERSSRSSKRRRADRLMNRENIGGDYTSEESVDDDDDEDEEVAAATTTSTVTAAAATASRLLHPVGGSVSNHHQHHHRNSHISSLGQQPNSNSTNIIGSNHHLQPRKSFPPGPPPPSKVFRAAPIWTPGDEIISVSVPRKARSASTKRSHDWISSSSNINGGGGGGAAGGEQIFRQASSSPVRQGIASTATAPQAAPMSPSSSNALFRKKLHCGNNGGQKLKPPKSSSKQQSSSNPEELEIEIAEVLYGLMTQSQGPSSKKEDSREINRSSCDAPISNSPSVNNQILEPNSSPLPSVAPKRKKPRQVPENSSYGARSSPISAKLEMDQTAKSEISFPKLEKISGSKIENGFEINGCSVNSQGKPVQPTEPAEPDSMKIDSEFKHVDEESRESRNFVAKEDVSSPSKKESPIVRYEDSICMESASITTASVAATMIKSNPMVSNVETQRENKFEIDLMAPPQQTRSSPERVAKIRSRAAAVDQKPVLSTVDAGLKQVVPKDKEDEKEKSAKEHPNVAAVVERKGEEAAESKKEIGLQFDLEKPERNLDAAVVNGTANKLQQQTKKEQHHEVPLKANKEEPLDEKSCQPKISLPLPMPMVSWPGGLPPMGYMAAPLQGVVSMDGSNIAPAPIPSVFSQPRSKRCATHCYIARNIHGLQQIMKINPFWQATAGSASSLFGPKPSILNVAPSDSHENAAVRGPNTPQDKGQHTVSNSPNHAVKDNKASQTAVISDSAKRNQHILMQQQLPPVAPSNLMGPTFIFPLNHQQAAMAAASARLSSASSSNTATSAGASASAAAAAATAMSFNGYPTMAANETQYLAILQNNNGYPFPMPPNYRGTQPTAQGAMPLFNGSFYPSQMIHPSQLHHPQQNASGTVNGGPQKQKSHPPQQLQHPSRSRHSESEVGCEDSTTQPTASDSSRGARAPMNIYGQNFVMPMMNPQNFALMNPQAAFANASSSSPGNEKKSQQQQSFAMSFGPINSTGTGPAMDMSSMAQNHAIFQSFPESTRQNIQTMFAAAAAQAAQKNNFRMSDDDNKTADAERKSSATPKAAHSGGGQSIAFTRSDLADSPASSVQTNGVMESSGRSINGTSGPSRSSRPVTPNAHLQQQNGVSRSKTNQISEHLNSSSTTAPKFPNPLCGYPQDLAQKMIGSGPSVSPLWKNSTRTTPTSQASSTAANTTLKNLPRTPTQMHTQISFGVNQKPATTTSSHGGQAPPPCSNQSLSPSISASPRTSSASTNTKMGHQSPSLSKNSPSITNQKSPSILGNPSVPHQQQQQPPKTMQQAQLYFTNPYSQAQVQAQSTHSTAMNSHSSGPSGFYMQRKRQDNTSTNDPAKAIAAATSNGKGGGGLLSSQGIVQAAQFAAQPAGTTTTLLPNGFTYAHPVPAAVQVKPAEQKQPAGNDNVHPWQPEKK